MKLSPDADMQASVFTHRWMQWFRLEFSAHVQISSLLREAAAVDSDDSLQGFCSTNNMLSLFVLEALRWVSFTLLAQQAQLRAHCPHIFPYCAFISYMCWFCARTLKQLRAYGVPQSDLPAIVVFLICLLISVFLVCKWSVLLSLSFMSLLVLLL